MKGEITYRILKFIEDGVFMNLNFLEAVAVSGYGASYKKLEFEEQRIARKRKSLVDSFYLSEEERPRMRRKLSKMIYKLKKDHLIVLDKKENQFYLTKRGQSYISDFRKKRVDFSPQTKRYPVQKDKVLKIIAFDIPEKERFKRRWLYSVLKNIGFEMLQKSVWIGENKIPREMIKDLSRFGLLDHVEIFEVLRKGSLE